MDNDHDREIMLAELAAKRKAAQWDGYMNLADFHGGYYDCDFVSPYTKSAGNTSSKIFVMLQDWSSEDGLSGPRDPETKRFGYAPSVATNRNLERLLKEHFEVSISQVYATNLFPFIKPGGMSSSIRHKELLRAAKEFALPQVKIVAPRLVIALGMTCFNILRNALDEESVYPLSAAIESPIDSGPSRIWCQAHTGWGACHRGGADVVNKDWRLMAEWFKSHQ